LRHRRGHLIVTGDDHGPLQVLAELFAADTPWREFGWSDGSAVNLEVVVQTLRRQMRSGPKTASLE